MEGLTLKFAKLSLQHKAKCPLTEAREIGQLRYEIDMIRIKNNFRPTYGPYTSPNVPQTPAKLQKHPFYPTALTTLPDEEVVALKNPFRHNSTQAAKGPAPPAGLRAMPRRRQAPKPLSMGRKPTKKAYTQRLLNRKANPLKGAKTEEE